ncbi:MAG TPA: DUF4013 domain-containing protein [Pyrinomonadaceae bacterium]|nr:DUF4013 domain-containing protein [Pyrinomonadaceae bacterium]
MSAQVEVWRVTTPEGTFETDLETLKQWIAEGCVLSTDKVSKGSLNWIEAGRVPLLRSAFSGPIASNEVATVTAEPPTPAWPPVARGEEVFSASMPDFPPPISDFQPPGSYHHPIATPAVCQNHPNADPHYVCRACEGQFCKACPRFVRDIPICPSCGDLCRPFQEQRSKVARQEVQGSGFGFEDLSRALRYPLQHKIALVSGALIYGLLMLAGFRGAIIAYVIMFGCISHVISQVAWGRLHRSFLPDFSSFSLWDDFAVPLGLGIGITIVTWGPVIVLFLALLFGVFSVAGRSPSLVSAGPDAQSSTLGEEDLSVLMDPEADPKKLEEANKKLNETRPGSVISREAERSQREQSDPSAGLKMLLPYLGAGIAIVLLFLAGLAWGIFYYPMALTVAGYTQSFGSVINPLVGLDTIRRMRGNYFKAFGMVLVLQIAGFVVSVIVAIVTSPLALPFFGNLPARFIDGSVTFYFNLVVACLLGLALYKSADQLGISVE